MTNTPYDIRSLFPEEIAQILKENGIEAYRAGQILSWLEKGAASFEEMTNLSLAHREKLSGIFALCISGTYGKVRLLYQEFQLQEQ